ncbi:MAG: prepilin-type N-terminal cleavage/methylation domain-containing protein [Acidobacteria bacterium]|nr:MAG: prepilin-type N-terminal cleavage/methylation domain-containing protein [Acidobacteriota bacterium]
MIVKKLLRIRGLTLVELLIVLTIVALLAGIIWAVLQPARDRALQTTCASKLRQIWLALETYRQDYRGIDPPAAKNPIEAGLPATSYSSDLFKAQYVKRFPGGFHCPTHKIPPYELAVMRRIPNHVCTFPCLDAQGRLLEACPSQNCAQYWLGYDAYRDHVTQFPSDMAEAEQRHREREDALFRILGMNFEIVYDEHHNPYTEYHPSDRWVYLFVHLDGHYSRKIIPPFVHYRYNLYEELIGD